MRIGIFFIHSRSQNRGLQAADRQWPLSIPPKEPQALARVGSILFVFLVAGLVFAEGNFKYDAKSKRDPFVPLVSDSGAYVSDAYGIDSVSDVRLEGILWDEARGSIAIINGEIVKEGQKIGTIKILKIEKDAVIFDVEGEEVRVKLTTD